MELRKSKRGLLLAGLACEMVYLVAVLQLSWERYTAPEVATFPGQLTRAGLDAILRSDRLYTWPQLLGKGWWSLIACLVAIALLMAAYSWGWRLVSRSGAGPGSPAAKPPWGQPRGGRATGSGADQGAWPGLRRLIWAGAILFALTLFWLQPITSDLFTYLSKAHVVADLEQNPYEVAPLEAGVEADYDAAVLAYHSPYSDETAVYGPAWTLLSVPGALEPLGLIGGLAYLKGLALTAFLGGVWLVERILREIRPADAIKGLYLLAWNPLVLLMAVGDGHNDMVMVTLVLLAFWLLIRERPVAAFAVLALSVWIKYVSVVFVPFFVLYVLRARARSAPDPNGGFAVGTGGQAIAGGIVAATSVSAVVLTPFWSPQVFSGIVERLLYPANWHGEGTWLATGALVAGSLLFAGASLLVLRWLARGKVSFQRLANATFVVALLAFVLGAARSQPWHLIWAAVLAGLSDRTWAWPLIAGLSPAMLAAQIWVEWGMPGL